MASEISAFWRQWRSAVLYGTALRNRKLSDPGNLVQDSHPEHPAPSTAVAGHSDFLGYIELNKNANG